MRALHAVPDLHRHLVRAVIRLNSDAGIVNKNGYLAEFLGNLAHRFRHFSFVGGIGGERRRLDATRTKISGRVHCCHGVYVVDRDHRAFRPERLGFGKADSTRPTGDNGHTAFDAQIHGLLLNIVRDELSRRRFHFGARHAEIL